MRDMDELRKMLLESEIEKILESIEELKSELVKIKSEAEDEIKDDDRVDFGKEYLFNTCGVCDAFIVNDLAKNPNDVGRLILAREGFEWRLHEDYMGFSAVSLHRL